MIGLNITFVDVSIWFYAKLSYAFTIIIKKTWLFSNFVAGSIYQQGRWRGGGGGGWTGANFPGPHFVWGPLYIVHIYILNIQQCKSSL